MRSKDDIIEDMRQIEVEIGDLYEELRELKSELNSVEEDE